MSWKNTEEDMRRSTLLHERGLKSMWKISVRTSGLHWPGGLGESAHNFRCGRNCKDCADRTFPLYRKEVKINKEIPYGTEKRNC
jgi:hypothetical protein